MYVGVVSCRCLATLRWATFRRRWLAERVLLHLFKHSRRNQTFVVFSLRAAVEQTQVCLCWVIPLSALACLFKLLVPCCSDLMVWLVMRNSLTICPIFLAVWDSRFTPVSRKWLIERAIKRIVNYVVSIERCRRLGIQLIIRCTEVASTFWFCFTG